jgi:hypothetical protein
MMGVVTSVINIPQNKQAAPGNPQCMFDTAKSLKTSFIATKDKMNPNDMVNAGIIFSVRFILLVTLSIDNTTWIMGAVKSNSSGSTVFLINTFSTPKVTLQLSATIKAL